MDPKCQYMYSILFAIIIVFILILGIRILFKEGYGVTEISLVKLMIERELETLTAAERLHRISKLPVLKELATNIIDQQKTVIADLERILEALNQNSK